jgi:hypothetical protein
MNVTQEKLLYFTTRIDIVHIGIVNNNSKVVHHNN